MKFKHIWNTFHQILSTIQANKCSLLIIDWMPVVGANLTGCDWMIACRLSQTLDYSRDELPNADLVYVHYRNVNQYF